MMVLGIVLHSALTYNVTNHGKAWNLKDPNTTSELTDFLVLFIHSFRMPIFFVIAGFFGALLFYNRGYLVMLKNRISRIGYPFILFLILLWPTIIFCFSYTFNIFSGHSNAFSNASNTLSNISDFIPDGTFHLWFLYTLFQITLASIGIGLILKNMPKFTKYLHTIFISIFIKPIWCVLIFTGLTVGIYLLLDTSMIEASVSLIPDVKTFTFYLFFYLIGWLLFTSQKLLNSMTKYAWSFSFIALFLLTSQAIMTQLGNPELWMPNSNSLLAKVLSAIIVWLFTFGITGLFIKYRNNYSSKMRYISDASYWVYLIHLPLTALIPAFLVNWSVPALIKFVTVVVITSAICFISYHYLVRSTFIGRFLNGRTYPRK